MLITKTHKIIISTVVVLVLLGIYITFDRNSKNEDNQPTLATSTVSGIESNIGTTIKTVDLNTKVNGNYKIELDKSSSDNQPIPDLNRPTTSSSYATVASEAKALAVEKIVNIQAKLKNNPADLSAWLDLAMYQKSNGDYQGAIISWKYAGRLAPMDYISVANIGNLYAYFLHDNAQAEIYYKQAIVKGPAQPYLYTQLAEIYRDIFKDLDKARAIIEQGLVNIPNDPNLLQFKESLNK